MKMKTNKIGYVIEVRDENDKIVQELNYKNSYYRRNKKWKTYCHIATGQSLCIE